MREEAQESRVKSQDSLSGIAATVRSTAYGGEGADGVPAQALVVSNDQNTIRFGVWWNSGRSRRPCIVQCLSGRRALLAWKGGRKMVGSEHDDDVNVRQTTTCCKTAVRCQDVVRPTYLHVPRYRGAS